MNGFFTDNQTKQKAYDRYYNEMAKSDFVQGSKLKALIQQESMDDASVASLANLFQQVMAQSREYDYDLIAQKLTKSAPKVVKGKKKSNAEAMGDIYDMMGDVTPKASTKKKHTFVPESTDTDVNMEFGNEPTYEEMFHDENFMRYMDDIDYHRMSKGLDVEQVYQDRIRKYLSKNKDFRNKIFNQRRKMSKDDIDDKATEMASIFTKRKRQARQPDEASPNLRPTKGVKKEMIERKMSSADLGDGGDANDVGDTNAKDVSEKVNKYFNKVVSSHKTANRNDLLQSVKDQFESVVNSRKGENYFDEHAPKMTGRHTKKHMKSYKSELKKWMNEILSSNQTA